MRHHRRGNYPLITLKNKLTDEDIPVMYWENSIGRSKNSDIVILDPSVSHDHAVLFRREEGWMVCDTGSKLGTYVNGEKIKEPTQVYINDKIKLGSTSFSVKKSGKKNEQKKSWFFKNGKKKAINPSVLMFFITFFHFLVSVELFFYSKKEVLECFLPFFLTTITAWLFFIITKLFTKRSGFELESIGFFLCGIGIILISGLDTSKAYVQIAAFAIGLFVFGAIIWFIENLERVMRWRMAITVAAIVLFLINIAIGKEIHGSKNWINVAGISLQPSEFIKIAFIFCGASTLERLQTTKNITGFILFSTFCVACLFIMKDFGTACIFFVTFLIIAFMRSGSIRTVILSCSAALAGIFIILRFKPYIADRFAIWGHVWEHVQEGGFQQSRVLSYSASGGLLGVGAGNGLLKNIFAGTSDLMFGTICEELGLLIAVLAAIAIAFIALFSRATSRHSRSTFYSISACGAAGMLVFQTGLHIFGATDILPMTGVTLPFVSLGGSSMVAVWGLLAFIKASDERTYALKRE
jgi:cell division protein FtsW (lipid II flippase)